MANNTIQVRIDGSDAKKGSKVVVSSLDNMSKKSKSAEQAITTLSAAAKQQQQRLATLSNAAQKTASSFSDVAAKLQSLIFVVSGFSLLRKIVTIGAEFEAQMVRVAVISSSTNEQLSKLTKTARYLGSTTQFSASQVAKGMEYLALAGMKANQVVEAMPGLLGLAASAGEDLATMSDIVSDQLSALGMHAGETGRMADAMAFAMSHANTTVSMLGQGMSYASPVMKTAQQSMESVITALSLMSNVGIKSTRAGTAIRMGMLRLIGPPKKAKEALTEFNVAVTDIATGKVRDVADILENLNKATTNISAGEKLSRLKDLFGVEALPGMIELLNQSKIGIQTIDIMGESVSLTTTKFKDFRLETRLAQSEGQMLVQAMQLTGTEFKNVEGFVQQYDKALNQEIATGQTLRAAFLDQGNASHELVAALAVLEKQDVKTGTATKMLSSFVEEMISPSEKASKTFDLIADAAGKPIGEIQDFSQIIGYLGKITADMSDNKKLATYLTIVGDSGMKGAEALKKLVEESQELEKVGDGMSKVTGTSQEMAEKMTKNLMGSWKTLGSSIEELWITIFGDIGEPLDNLTKKATEFVRWFTSIWPTISSAIGVILSPLNMVVTAFQTLSTWVGQSAAQFSLLTEGLSFTEKLQYAIQIAFNYIQGIDWSSAGRAILTTFIDGILSVGEAIYDAVLSAFEWVASLLPHSNAEQGPFSRLYESGVAFVTTIIEGIVSVGSGLFSAVVEIFEPVLPYLESFLKAISAYNFVKMIAPHFQGISSTILGGIKEYGTVAIRGISTAITTIVQGFNAFRTSVFATATISFFAFLIKNIPTVISFVGRLINVITGIISALGGLANIATMVITVFSNFTLVGKAIVGIGAAGTLIYSNWDIVAGLANTIVTKWQEMDNSLKLVFTNIVVGIGLIGLALMGSPVLALVGAIGLAAHKMGIDFTAAIEGIISHFKAIGDFFIEPFDMMKTSVLIAIGIIGTAIAALIIKIRRSMQLQAFARECKNNPLMKCMLPDERDKKRWNAFKQDLKEGQRGFALMSNKTDCGKMGNCFTNNALKAQKTFQLIERSTGKTYDFIEGKILEGRYKLENDSKQTAIRTRKTWLDWAKNIGNTFAGMWTGIVNQSKNAVNKIHNYVKEARFTGSGVTDMRRKELLEQTERLAGKYGTERYESKRSMFGGRRETEEFKKLKEQAQAQAQANRSFMQQMVVKFSDTIQTISTKTSHIIKQTGQGAASLWQKTLSNTDASFNAIRQKADATYSALRQKASDYSRFAQSSNQQFTTGTPSPQTSGGLDKGATQALQQQQTLMKQLGATSSTTSAQTGAAFDNMGQKAVGYTNRLTKVGIAALAIGGITLAFSGSANAASELDQLQQKTSLLEQATQQLSAAWAWLWNNLDTVAMIGLTVLGSGLIELTTALGLLAKTAGLAAAAFVGWKIGEFLYQFEAVQDVAITTVGVFVEFADSIQSAFNSITSIDFSALGNSILNSITNVFSEGLPEIESNLNEIWSGLGDVFTFPADTFGGLADSLGTALGEATSAISEGNFAEAGSLLISGLIEGVQSVGGNLADVFGGVIKMAADVILPDSWSGPASELIDGFTTTIKVGSSFIIDLVQVGIEAAGSYISGVSWSGLGNDLLQGFIAVFSGGPIIAAVQGMMTGAKNYLAGLSWSSEGQSLLQTLGSGIKAAGGLLVAAIQGAINAVKSYISSIDLSASGRAMIATIGRGITSAAANLKSQVSGVLGSVRNLLPFSDAREGPLSTLTKSGESIPETLAKGIQKRSSVLFGAMTKTMDETQKALSEAGKRLKETQMTPEQIQAEELRIKGLSEAHIGHVQSLEALADAKELLADTEKKLSEVGKTSEQLKIEALAQRGVNSELLEQIALSRVAVEVAEKRHDLTQQIAYAGMDSYEKELEALRRKGATEKDILSVVELRTELEQKKNETVLRNMSKELEFLGMSKKKQAEFNVLKKFGAEYATESQKQDLLQKQQLIEAQKEYNQQWDNMTNRAGDYFEKIIVGSMSATNAFRAFADDMKNAWAKSLADMAKQQLQNVDFGSIAGSVGALFSGGKSASNALSGLGSAIGGLISNSEAATGSLGTLSGPIGMGALSSGMSLLQGDTAGAAQGLATLAGSMTPLGPLGGIIAGQLVTMAGIGAEWVRESEWVVLSMKGMVAEFSKGFREVKDGFVSGGSRTGYEALDTKTIKQFNDALGKTAVAIEEVNNALGTTNAGGLIAGMSDFRYHIEAMEDKGQGWFDEQFEQMRVNMVKHAIENMAIEGVDTDASAMLANRFSSTFEQVLTGSFSSSAREEVWDGVLTKFATQDAMAAGLQEQVANQLSERLQGFVDASSEELRNMPIDKLEGVLQNEITSAFSDIAVSIPASITQELAQVLAGRVSEAVKFAAGDIDSASFVVTEDKQFFETMRTMVREFEGTEEEIIKLVNDLTKLKDATKDAALNTDILTKEFITLNGGATGAAEKIAFFGDKFVTEAQKQSTQLQSSLGTVGDILSELGADAPRTRAEFTALVQSLSAAGPEYAKLTQKLLDAAPAFDSLYSALEKVFSIDASSIGKNLMDAIFNAESAEQAGQKMADRFAEQFYQQMIGSVMNSVAQTIFNGIVSPFLNSSAQAALNMAEGGVISATTLSEGSAISATTMAQGGAVAGTTLNEGAAISATTMAEGGTFAATTLNEGSIASATNIAEGGTVAGTNVGTGGEIASNSIVAGGTIAADALAAIVEDVKQKMQIMAEVMTQLKEEGVMDQIQSAMMYVGSTAYQAVQASPAVTFQKATISAPEISAPEFSAATDTMADSITKTIPIVDSATESFTQAQLSIEEMIKSREEAARAAAEFNADIQSQIEKMGLKGLELALFDLSKEFENTRKSAVESGGNLAQVERLFGLKKQAIIDQFHEEELEKQKTQNEAILNLQNSVKQTISNFTEFEYTITQLAEKYPKLTEIINQSGISYKEALDKIATMSDTEWREMAKTNNVSIEEFVADTEKAVGAFESLKEALIQESKVITGFQANIMRLKSGLSDSENTIIQIAKKYPLITEAIENSGMGYEEILQTVANMTDEQLRYIAKTNGVTVEELVQDAESVIGAYNDLKETLKQESQVISSLQESLNKMTSGMNDAEYTITQLATKYPLITDAIEQSGMSYEQILTHMTNMTETEWRELAKANGVTVNELVSDAEKAVDAFESLNETLKQESQVISSLQESLNKMTSGMNDAEYTITQLATKYPLITDAIEQSGMSYEQILTHMTNMTETEWRELAKANGVTVNELVSDAEKAVDAFESLNETLKQESQVISSLQESLNKMTSGMNDAEYTITQLATKYPLITDVIVRSGLGYEEVIKHMANMTESEWREMAKMNGVGIEEFVADAERAVNAFKDINEVLEQEQSAIFDFQSSLKQMLSGVSDAEHVIIQLAEKYPLIAQTVVSYEDIINGMVDMTASEWREMSAVVGVSVDEFVSDAEKLANAIKTSQEQFSDWIDSLNDFAGNKTQNVFQDVVKIIPDELGMVADAAGVMFNGIRVSSEDLANEILSLSTSPIEMLKIAKDAGFSSVNAFMSAVDTLLPLLSEVEQKTTDFRNQMTEFMLSDSSLTEAERQIVDLMGTFTNINVPKFALESNLKDIAAQLVNASEDELLHLADSLGVSYDVLIEKAPVFLEAAQEIQDGLNQTIDSIKEIGYEGTDYEKTLDGLGQRFGQLSQVTDYASISFEQMRTEILGMSTDDLLGLVDTLGIGINELQNVTQEYLEALYQFNEATSEFRDNMLRTVSKFTEDETFLKEWGKTFSDFGATQSEAAQRLGNLTNEEIKESAATLGLLPSQFMETATQYVDALGNIEQTVQDFSSSMKSMLPNYDANIETMRELGNSYGQMLSSQFINIENAIHGLSNLSPSQVQKLADRMGVGVTEFTENMESYVSALNDVNSSIVDVKKDVQKSIKTLRMKLEGAGATSSERLLELQSAINLNMPFSQENLEKITEYKELLLETMDEEIQQAKDLQDAVSKLDGLINNLKLDDNLSVLNDFEKYEEARRQYEDIKTRALGGDIDAVNALESVSKIFLERSRQYNASGQDYSADYQSTIFDLERIKGNASENVEGDAVRKIQESSLAELERLNPIFERMSASLFNVNQTSSAIIDATMLSGEQIIASIERNFVSANIEPTKIDKINVPEFVIPIPTDSKQNEVDEIRYSNTLLQQQNAILKNILDRLGVNNQLIEEQTDAVLNSGEQTKRELKRNRQISNVR